MKHEAGPHEMTYYDMVRSLADPADTEFLRQIDEAEQWEHGMVRRSGASFAERVGGLFRKLHIVGRFERWAAPENFRQADVDARYEQDNSTSD